MDFGFIATAYAEQAANPGVPNAQAGIAQMIPIILLLLILYMFLWRPQLKREKELKKMLAELTKGDEVVTNGGLLGKVIKVGDNFVVIEVAEGTEVKIQRQAISSTVPKGTMKNI